jgi:mono/diheme cytochrome c family protein
MQATFTFCVRKTILLIVALAVFLGTASAQGKKDNKPGASQADAAAGKQIFVRYCASCHGVDAKGNGPAAIAMKTPPPDLTELAKRNDGKYPAGYVGALLKFGKSLASHGSEDMPVWGSRFKIMDPTRDPTGQKHVDCLVVYLESLQVK